MKTRKKEQQPFVGISVSGANPDSIKAAQAAIDSIINSPAADAVKGQALAALDGLCGVRNTTISNCTIATGAAT